MMSTSKDGENTLTNRHIDKITMDQIRIALECFYSPVASLHPYYIMWIIVQNIMRGKRRAVSHVTLWKFQFMPIPNLIRVSFEVWQHKNSFIQEHFIINMQYSTLKKWIHSKCWQQKTQIYHIKSNNVSHNVDFSR